jgi:hypothetical protein
VRGWDRSPCSGGGGLLKQGCMEVEGRGSEGEMNCVGGGREGGSESFVGQGS